MSESLGEAFYEVLADTSQFGEGLEEGISEALAGVEGEVAAALDGVGDAASGAFDGIGGAAEDAASTVGDAFEGAASEVQEAIDGISFEDVANKVEENLGKITLAGAAAGAAAEGFARSQAESNATLARTAIVTGESEESLRDMIAGMVDHTFAAEDAARGMDRLMQAGVTTREEFEAILPAMDDFADATGQDLVKSIDTFDRVLSALDIPFTEAEEHLDALTFLQTQTTVSMDNLGMVMRREASTLREYGMGTDDVAVAMAALEAEGIRGPRAVMAFQNALAEGGGTLEGFEEALGVSAETLDLQRDRLAEAEGMTEAFADANNATMTPLERLQANVQNLMFRFGAMANVAGVASGALAAVGPVAFGLTQGMTLMAKVGPALSTAIGGVTKAFNFLRVAILTNPIFLIAAVIIGIIAVIWIFRDEIMEALGQAWDWIKETAGSLWEWFGGIVETVVQAVGGFIEGLRDWFVNVFTNIVEFIQKWHPLLIAWRLAQEYVPRIIEAVADLVGRFLAWVTDLRDRVVSGILAMRDRVVDGIRGLRDWVLDAIRGLVDGVTGFIRNLIDIALGLRRRILDALGNIGTWLLQAGRDLIQGMIDGIGRMGSAIADAARNIARRALDSIKSFFGISSPSTVFMGVGEDLMRGLAVGIERSAGQAVDEVGELARQLTSAADLDALERMANGRFSVNVNDDGFDRPRFGGPPPPRGGDQVTIVALDPSRAAERWSRELAWRSATAGRGRR